MKIFLSWHGKRSRAIAEALNDWLHRVIQAVKPFYSPDIEKGAKWSSEIDSALEGTRFGIICLTPDNLESTWIHYEAGALSKTKDAMIWTYLHELTPGDVPQPLGKFQHTVAEKSDTFELLRTINKRLAEVGGEPLTDALLADNFDLFWPKLAERLSAAKSIPLLKLPRKTVEMEMPRDERAILNEILELVRNQERKLSRLDDFSRFPRLSPSKRRVESLLKIEIPEEWSEEDTVTFGRTLAEKLEADVLETDAKADGKSVQLMFHSQRYIDAPNLSRIITDASKVVDPNSSQLSWQHRLI